jgi:5-methylcytosine-specific restriction enzyme subunit McrC
MLAYAFQILNEDSYSKIAAEEFDHASDLLAAILSKGISNQIKRGLGREYLSKVDSLSSPAGKIDVSASVKQRSVQNRKLVCEFDEFTENAYINRILKTTALLLIRCPEVSLKQRQALRKVLLYFHNIDVIDPNQIKWTSIKYNRNNATYKMLLNLCYIIIEGMLLSEQAGTKKLSRYIDDQRMHSLYERFVLEYYKKHYHELRVSAPQIPWNVDDGIIDFLPLMKSDITIEYLEKTLIIDTKYYQHTMQTNDLFNSRTIHSNNLYQIFTYVKNRDITNPGKVGGALLYAKTDEDITPDNDYRMGGNQISVKTLDLNTDFSQIKSQLNDLVSKFFGFTVKDQELIDEMASYLAIFELNDFGSEHIIEIEMQETMISRGFVDLWEDNLDKYKIKDIRIEDPRSYQPAIDQADLVMMKILISYYHRGITHWYETSLFNYRKFFIYAIKRLLSLI